MSDILKFGRDDDGAAGWKVTGLTRVILTASWRSSHFLKRYPARSWRTDWWLRPTDLAICADVASPLNPWPDSAASSCFVSLAQPARRVGAEMMCGSYDWHNLLHLLQANVCSVVRLDDGRPRLVHPWGAWYWLVKRCGPADRWPLPVCLCIRHDCDLSGDGMVPVAEKDDRYGRGLERWRAESLGHRVGDLCGFCQHRLTGSWASNYSSGIFLFYCVHISGGLHRITPIVDLFSTMGWKEEISGHGSRPTSSPSGLLDRGLTPPHPVHQLTG